MSQEQERIQDRWQQHLDEQHARLSACQKEHSVTSCLQCSHLLGCEQRNAYVHAVYESMNKGQGGGFEF